MRRRRVQNPKGPAFETQRQRLMKAHQLSHLFTVSYADDHLSIQRIQVRDGHQGMGHARRAMQEITDWADHHGVRLSLTPDTAYGSSKKRLTDWYRSHGFVPNKGRNKDYVTTDTMIRPPKRQNPVRRRNPDVKHLANHIFNSVHGIMAADGETRDTADWMMQHQSVLIGKGGAIYDVAVAVAARKAPKMKAPEVIEGVAHPAISWGQFARELGKEGEPVPGSPVFEDTPDYQGKSKTVPAKRIFTSEAGTFTVEMKPGKGRETARGKTVYFEVDTAGVSDPEVQRNLINNIIRATRGFQRPPVLWVNAPAAPTNKTAPQLADAIAKTVDKDGRSGRGKTRQLSDTYASGDLVERVLGIKLGAANQTGGWRGWYGPDDTDIDVFRFVWSQRVPRFAKAVASVAASNKVHRDQLKATQTKRQSAAAAKLDGLIEKYTKILGTPPVLPPRITSAQEANMPAPLASMDDVDARTAAQAFDGTSFSAEKRGVQYRRDYASMWNKMAEEVVEQARTVGQRRVAIDTLDRFLPKYRAAFRSFLSSHSNVTSWMITGRGGRNERREQKKGASADNRRNEWLELIGKAKTYALRDMRKEKQHESGGETGVQLLKLKHLVAAKKQGQAVGPKLKAATELLDDLIVRERAAGTSGTVQLPSGDEVEVEITDDRIKLDFPKGDPLYEKLSGFNYSHREGVMMRKLTGNALQFTSEVLGFGYDWSKLIAALKASEEVDNDDALPSLAEASKMYKKRVALAALVESYIRQGRPEPGQEAQELASLAREMKGWPAAFTARASGHQTSRASDLDDSAAGVRMFQRHSDLEESQMALGSKETDAAYRERKALLSQITQWSDAFTRQVIAKIDQDTGRK
jgi:hypothetical protein